MFQSLKQLVIVGNNLDAMLVAHTFRQAFPKKKLTITIEGPAETPQSAISVLGPAFKQLILAYSNDELSWMNESKSAFHLGHTLNHWARKPFSLTAHNDIDAFFHPLLLELCQLRRQSYAIDFESQDFCFNQYLADNDRIPLASNFPFTSRHGYQVDSQQTYNWLLSLCNAQGIVLNQAVSDNNAGDPHSLRIHCSQSVKNHESTSHLSLPNVRKSNFVLRATVPNSANEKTMQVSQCMAHPYGYITQRNTSTHSELHFYGNTGFVKLEQAQQVFRALLHERFNLDTEIEQQAFQSHVMQQGWHDGNELYLGNQFAIQEPIAHHPLDEILNQVTHLIELFKKGTDMRQIKEAFNQACGKRATDIHAFNSCLYLFSERRDTPYWQIPQNPSSLTPYAKSMMDIWFSGKDIPPQADGLFQNIDWTKLFDAMSLYPPAQNMHPAQEEITKKLSDMTNQIEGCALNYVPLKTQQESKA